MIQTYIDGSVVLDLFAGSGAFGVECISRNAKKVYFVDREQKAIDTIKINTKDMNEDFTVLKSDYLTALENFKTQNLKFDIIYLDPPYKSDFAMKSMELIAKYNLLEQNGIVIVEHESENDLIKIPSCYIMEKSRKYGIAYVDIFKINKG